MKQWYCDQIEIDRDEVNTINTVIEFCDESAEKIGTVLISGVFDALNPSAVQQMRDATLAKLIREGIAREGDTISGYPALEAGTRGARSIYDDDYSEGLAPRRQISPTGRSL